MACSALRKIRQCIEDAAISLCADSTHRTTMLRVLARPGYALDPESPCRSASLTLEVFRAIGGSLTDTGVLAAAAVELQVEAGFILDDVVDDEVDTREGLTPAEQLALAVSLLACGSALAARAAREAPLRLLSSNFLMSFHWHFLVACGGQFLDARLQRLGSATGEQALKMTAFKAGYLGMFAGGVAARLATDDPSTIRSVDAFGFNLFTYAQIVDDLRDACPGNGRPGDLDRGKKTVPLVLFAHRHQDSHDRLAPEGVRQAFEESDARACSTILAEVFLNRARRCLLELEHQRYGVVDLEGFLESFDRPAGQGPEPTEDRHLVPG